MNAWVWFLHSARCLMLIDIYLKLREDSLNGFQVIEQTRFCERQSSKENNSKSINARVMVLALCTSANVDWYLYEVSWWQLKRFSSYRAETILWQSSKGNNSKSINAWVMVLALCTLSNVDLYMKFREDSLNSFQVTEWTGFSDGKVPGETTKKL